MPLRSPHLERKPTEIPGMSDDQKVRFGVFEADPRCGELRSEERLRTIVKDTPLRRFGRVEQVAVAAVLPDYNESASMTGTEISIDVACWTAPQPSDRMSKHSVWSVLALRCRNGFSQVGPGCWPDVHHEELLRFEVFPVDSIG